MTDEEYAVRVFQHYITLVMRQSGLVVDSDVYAEIEAAIDAIIQAAVKEQDVDEFPPIPEFEPLCDLRIDAQAFKRALKRVFFAVSDDEARPALHGVNLHVEDGKLYLTGTDGYRLAVDAVEAEMDDEIGWPNYRWILPYETASNIVAVLDEGEATLEYGESTENLYTRITAENMEIVMLNVNESYPKWKELTASFSKYTKFVEIPARALEKPLKIVKKVSDSALTIMTVTPDQAVIGTASDDRAIRTETVVPVQGYEGEPFTFGYNATFLQDLLKVVLREGKDAVLRFWFEHPRKAFAIEIVGEDDFLYVVMPRTLEKAR